MRLLLGTHAFLWFVWNDPRLPSSARTLIEDSETVYLSIASAWEIAIKVSNGKLALAQPWDQFLPEQISRNSIEVLPISVADVCLVAELPFHHRDPFDRLLVAQCLTNGIPLLSTDSMFDPYGIQRNW